MALVEEELPGVNKGECKSCPVYLAELYPRVYSLHYLRARFIQSSIYVSFKLFVPAVRSEFRLREDHAIAHRLQEQECKISEIILKRHLPYIIIYTKCCVCVCFVISTGFLC